MDTATVELLSEIVSEFVSEIADSQIFPGQKWRRDEDSEHLFAIKGVVILFAGRGRSSCQRAGCGHTVEPCGESKRGESKARVNPWQ
ncbi:MAG: hypothetical protein CBC13_04610 [Planctomycetia bacterium TMED53]|nr:MAG: hypothetical protein CBC13_04610 [Planctomycetia bacterium TMED53]